MTRPQNRSYSGYTLIEALIASSLLLIGIAAAASMSLQLVTQEEINERANRSFNYIDNAVRLVQMGVDPSTVGTILPGNADVISMTFQNQTVNVPSLGARNRILVTFEYRATGSAATGAADIWTGGNSSDQRTESFEIYRSEHFLTEELPRVQSN